MDPNLETAINSSNSRKTWFILIAILILLNLFIFAALYLINHNKFPPENTPKQISTASTPNLFFLVLEYDPKTGATTLLNSGKTAGEAPAFLPSPPADSTANFVYRIQLTTENNELLQKGWQSLPKKVLENSSGAFDLRIITAFKPNTLLKVFSADNKLIWTQKIK